MALPPRSCTTAGTYNVLGKTCATTYNEQCNNKRADVMPNTGTDADIQRRLDILENKIYKKLDAAAFTWDCMADNPLLYGEGCDTPCSYDHKMTMGPGCYKAVHGEGCDSSYNWEHKMTVGPAGSACPHKMAFEPKGVALSGAAPGQTNSLQTFPFGDKVHDDHCTTADSCKGFLFGQKVPDFYLHMLHSYFCDLDLEEEEQQESSEG